MRYRPASKYCCEHKSLPFGNQLKINNQKNRAFVTQLCIMCTGTIVLFMLMSPGLLRHTNKQSNKHRLRIHPVSGFFYVPSVRSRKRCGYTASASTDCCAKHRAGCYNLLSFSSPSPSFLPHRIVHRLGGVTLRNDIDSTRLD